ncbi:MAG: PEPxxWA-CTERM sorting domain-containing protein [Rhizobiales bacterium]|nr:PEPxxWA-CTERM sorting domain-containing protein [Hyphomicrobiales bacterium]
MNASGYNRGGLPTGWNAVPGFETPDIASSAYVQTGAGFAQLLGPQEGDRYLDMNGMSPTGAISQDVAGLVAGSAATLTFWASSWAQNSSGLLTASFIDPLTSAVIATTTLSFPYQPSAASSVWTEYTLSGLVPASGRLRVLFSGDSSSTARGAPGLDNVALMASTITTGVPEPSTWAMMLIGFAGLGFAGYRKRAAVQPIRGRIA